ncbi:MAG: hypothetical protein NTV88_05145 [Candidatus Micrarchaeota archaeon]|nr:hypothetical protein [Candidatus Micrarchaeota archaeon]
MAIDKTKATVLGAIVLSIGIWLLTESWGFGLGIVLILMGIFMLYLGMFRKRKFETGWEEHHYRKGRANELGKIDARNEDD